MKKIASLLILSCLIFPGLAVAAKAGASNPHDTAAVIKLSQLEARKSMLALCGVTGDEAEKDLAGDKVKEAQYTAQLSDAGKASLPGTLARIDAGVKASWDKTPEDQRTKSCTALKDQMAAGK